MLFLAISLGQNLCIRQDDRMHIEVQHTPIIPKIYTGLNLVDFQGEIGENV